jgi:hypothetical protein
MCLNENKNFYEAFLKFNYTGTKFRVLLMISVLGGTRKCFVRDVDALGKEG